MKILILSKSDPNKINFIEDCYTRIDTFIFFIKYYIAQNNNTAIEIIIDKCYPYMKTNLTYHSSHMNNYEDIDHIIFINDVGFRGTHRTFIENLKKISNKSVLTLCNNIKYCAGEDTLLSFDNTIKNKYCYIKPPLNDTLYAPRKQKDHIYILLAKSKALTDKYVDDLLFILQKIKVLMMNNQNFIFTIGLINEHYIEFINTDLEIVETRQFGSYIDYVYELSKANMFFIYYPIVDNFLFYELAMCNTLIISKQFYVNAMIKKELDILTFSDDFKWSDIFRNLTAYNKRDMLMDQQYSWNNLLETIITLLGTQSQNTKSIQLNKNINENIIKTRQYILNTKDKSRATILDTTYTETLSNTSRNINKPSTNILLQSKLKKL